MTVITLPQSQAHCQSALPCLSLPERSSTVSRPYLAPTIIHLPRGVRLAGGKVGFLPAGGWLGLPGLGAGAPLPTGFDGVPFVGAGGAGLTGWRGGLPFAEADPAGGLRATVTPLGLVTKASNPRITVLRQCRLGCLWHFMVFVLNRLALGPAVNAHELLACCVERPGFVSPIGRATEGVSHLVPKPLLVGVPPSLRC